MMNGNPRRQVKPMNRTVTESYCITFEVKVNSSDQSEIDRRMECARQIYTVTLGFRYAISWRTTLYSVFL